MLCSELSEMFRSGQDARTTESESTRNTWKGWAMRLWLIGILAGGVLAYAVLEAQTPASSQGTAIASAADAARAKGTPGDRHMRSVSQNPIWNASRFFCLTQALTRRPSGEASASGLPAASSNCAWCARNTRAGSSPVGHQRERPFGKRFVASQNP